MTGIIRTANRATGTDILKYGGRIPNVSRFFDAPAVEVDPYYANVSLLLPFEGSPEDPITGLTFEFTDYSSNNFYVYSFDAGAVISTDDPDFPLGALDISGSDYARLFADSGLITAAFAFGTGDFTWEGYCKIDNTSARRNLFRIGSTPSPSVALAVLEDTSAFPNQWILEYEWSGGSGGTFAVLGEAIVGVRQHVAVCRAGSNLRLFIGGTQLGPTITDSGDMSVAEPVEHGAHISGSLIPSNRYFDGRISWVRITKGVARYTSNFTPPVPPFYYPPGAGGGGGGGGGDGGGGA